MKYSFGVPAWLGAIKVCVVLIVVPGLLATFVALTLGRRFELSRGEEFWVYILTLDFILSVWLFAVAVCNRRAAKKKKA